MTLSDPASTLSEPESASPVPPNRADPELAQRSGRVTGLQIAAIVVGCSILAFVLVLGLVVSTSGAIATR